MCCHCHNVRTNHIHSCHIYNACTLHIHVIIDMQGIRYKVHHANKCSDIQTLIINEAKTFKAFNGNVFVPKYFIIKYDLENKLKEVKQFLNSISTSRYYIHCVE